MQKFYLILLLIFPLTAKAQIITYDTIRVSPNDERNIHLYQQRKKTDNKTYHSASRDNKDNHIPAFDKSKLLFGADFGLSISHNFTNIGLGPQLGYQFNNHLMAGAGIKYYYKRSKTYDYEIKNNLLGANVFGYFYPVRFITIFIQPEINYTWSELRPESHEESISSRGYAPSLVAGAGFRLESSHVTLNYDLMQHTNSPHPSGLYLGISAFF
ncbi:MULTISPECIES: outer membrane beta-barrel protein [Proteiniphilum]|uniref:outer membrane beta-barrel protein n=1 Tax=Proteiniphilum TaxID=294702 RepID=UPI001EEB2068|nr:MULTISPECIES: outer membrane beta-barrel protein [Proteiniphilum]ULB35596.1 outer membrane beta-barrel protein [Proteiniphilum propionicum]